MKIHIFSRKKDGGVTFETMITPHMERLYRLSFHYTKNRADAEDLVQDLLIKLYPRCDELRKVEHLRPWLAKVLNRLYIDKYRRQQRNPVQYGYDESSATAPHSASILLSPEKTNLARDIHKAMTQLNDDQRMLVVMHDIEGYTLTELEAIFETPLGTLKSRLHRSRAKLRNLLTDGTQLTRRSC
ncbi:MAG: sigma-70 family RNA polymerase sigma factor [Gammaproteobacteria bacterium]|nr:sigma-70 family RNA polymerase sigma factor [Gammaproteobacteria bacterium]